MVVLSVVCAVILAVLATALAQPKERAKDIDRSKQMLIASHILDYGGYFLLQDKDGKDVPAKYTTNGELVPGTKSDYATNQQILDVYKKRIIPKLLSPENKLVSFADAKINEEEYLTDYRKSGYYRQNYKLIYEILPNRTANGEDKAQPVGFVIPVNGLGLWDAIYGYLAIKPDGNTVIGTTWYDQKETPGLGANIAEQEWQGQFPGKKIFQANPDGTTDYKTAPIGIIVVKGKVSEVYGPTPKANSAVDGMAGATLTGNGATAAFKDVLDAYRPFLTSLATASAAASSTSKKGANNGK